MKVIVEVYAETEYMDDQPNYAVLTINAGLLSLVSARVAEAERQKLQDSSFYCSEYADWYANYFEYCEEVNEELDRVMELPAVDGFIVVPDGFELPDSARVGVNGEMMQVYPDSFRMQAYTGDDTLCEFADPIKLTKLTSLLDTHSVS